MAGNRPIFTQNFSANLLAIQTFFGADGHQSFQGFLDRLFDEIVPRLCRFPKSGRSFLIHSIHSSEGKSLVKKLRRRLHVHDDLRECIVDEYLILFFVKSRLYFFPSNTTANSLSILSGFGKKRSNRIDGQG